jgi:aromatic-L-amino-acid decarboxylase
MIPITSIPEPSGLSARPGPVEEESLDPESWDELRAHGHAMMDELFDWLRTVRERPAWRPVPQEVRQALTTAVPVDGAGLAAAWQDFRALVLPFPWGNVHPRFWGWVLGSGSPGGALAELATAVYNVNAVGSGDNQAAPLVEAQVLDWFKTLLGFPPHASGTLVSGASMANVVGLAAARDAADPAVSSRGLLRTGRDLIFYASDQTHNSVEKAVKLMGLGEDGLRRIPVDEEYRIDVAALEVSIRADRAAGRTPCCVVGNAGTVNTGAFDDLSALAAVCRREALWLHVDGAFGALATLSDRLRPLVRGIDEADSVAFDLHKWLHVPYDAGCVLVRSEVAHRRPFATQASYLAPMERGAAPRDPGGLSPELSAGFRALKVWLSLKEHGTAKFARLIEQNVAQAAYLADRVLGTPSLELMAPVPLNIVCLRYRGDGSGDLDAVNREILMRLQERGIAVPSGTMTRGHFAIRVAITNHRSRREDLDVLVEAVSALGAEVTTEAGAPVR